MLSAAVSPSHTAPAGQLGDGGGGSGVLLIKAFGGAGRTCEACVLYDIGAAASRSPLPDVGRRYQSRRKVLPGMTGRCESPRSTSPSP